MFRALVSCATLLSCCPGLAVLSKFILVIALVVIIIVAAVIVDVAYSVSSVRGWKCVVTCNCEMEEDVIWQSTA